MPCLAKPAFVIPAQVVRPLEGNRSIPLLYRFSPRDQHGARHGHEIRKELHEQWVREPFPGSDFAARTEEETLGDMTRAVFCVTPPGNTQVRQPRASFWGHVAKFLLRFCRGAGSSRMFLRLESLRDLLLCCYVQFSWKKTLCAPVPHGCAARFRKPDTGRTVVII